MGFMGPKVFKSSNFKLCKLSLLFKSENNHLGSCSGCPTPYEVPEFASENSEFGKKIGKKSEEKRKKIGKNSENIWKKITWAAAQAAPPPVRSMNLPPKVRALPLKVMALLPKVKKFEKKIGL